MSAWLGLQTNSWFDKIFGMRKFSRKKTQTLSIEAFGTISTLQFYYNLQTQFGYKKCISLEKFHENQEIMEKKTALIYLGSLTEETDLLTYPNIGLTTLIRWAGFGLTYEVVHYIRYQ